MVQAPRRRSRFTPKMLAAVPKERDVVSFSHAVAEQQQIFVLKVKLMNGSDEPFMMPAVLAQHLMKSIGRAIQDANYQDLRRRVGDPRPEDPAIADFLANQPDIKDADWDAKAGGELRLAHDLEVHAEPKRIYLVALIDPSKSIYKVLRLPSPIVFYLREMIAECLRDGSLYFLPDDTCNSPPN